MAALLLCKKTKKGVQTMKERLQKLLTVKSIVTFALTGVFCYLAVVGKMSTEFLTIYTMIISFYFGTQVAKDRITGGES